MTSSSPLPSIETVDDLVALILRYHTALETLTQVRRPHDVDILNALADVLGLESVESLYDIRLNQLTKTGTRT